MTKWLEIAIGAAFAITVIFIGRLMINPTPTKKEMRDKDI